MNLLIVHNHYRIPGGEDTVVQNEYELLREMGHEVTLYTRHNDEIGGLTGFKRLALPFEFIYSKKTAKDITELIKAKKIDVVMVHNTLSLISPSVYYAAVKAGVPVVQTIHNFRLLCPKATLYRDGHICEDCIQKGLGCALRHRCYRGSFTQTLLCVISTKIHRKKGIYGKLDYICLTGFNRDKLLLLSGTDKDRIHIKPNFTANAGNMIPYDDRKNTFIYAGRLEEDKGITELLEAWFLLETKAKDPKDVPRLEVDGTGSLSQTARKYVEKHGLKRVNINDPLPHDDIIKEIARAKALILPTKWYEGFPMTIAEALTAGTPVIGTDLGNTGDLIKGGNNEAPHTNLPFTGLGALIDPADMAGSIARIISSWQEFSYNKDAFEKAAVKYGKEENKRIFEEILAEVKNRPVR
ncbi:MAG: glycosyltransferase [Lachnospiraceae bacterium]|nr:glycosyltransferase [Lachnospiraceae bacterium]